LFDSNLLAISCHERKQNEAQIDKFDLEKKEQEVDRCSHLLIKAMQNHQNDKWLLTASASDYTTSSGHHLQQPWRIIVPEKLTHR